MASTFHTSHSKQGPPIQIVQFPKTCIFNGLNLSCFPFKKSLTCSPFLCIPTPISCVLPGPAPDAPKQWRKQWQQEPWRNQMWHYISRSYLTSLWQFRQVVHLFCRLSLMKEDCIPTSVASLQTPTFHSIRFRKGKEHKKRKTAPYSHQHLNWLGVNRVQCTHFGGQRKSQRTSNREALTCAREMCFMVFWCPKL